ncbi:MAG: hypothetical protein CML66_30480 [Rhodobacteraceae bacterium]|nr:hypothetical protein [Paracoccaceae bacterium]MAY45712.1 hypothetical protein [Paracoccaceae bacterium]
MDRSGQVIAPLFEKGGETGSYAELSFGYVSPDVSGTAIGIGSGDMAEGYLQFGAAYKTDLDDHWSIAILFGQPYGADVSYPSGTGYPFADSTAELNSIEITGILRYRFDNGVSLHAGLRAQQLDADVSIPAIAGYSASAPSDTAFGYLVGAAYERPDIALRVALTYFSSITHDMTVTENSLATGAVVSPYEQEMPEAVNLDLQTGISKNTLLFGGVRWVNWGDFTIAPPVYSDILVGRPLAYYNGDYTTYVIGVGHKFTDEWSASVALNYEAQAGGYQSNLAPHDGVFGVTLGAKYTRDQFSISGGVNVSWIGDAETVVNRSPFLTSSFDDNMAVGVGFRVGYNF